MWFLAKSALCIGIVTALAAAVSGQGDVRSSLVSGGRDAVAGAGRACMASADCVRLGMRAVAAATGHDDVLPEALARAAMGSALAAVQPATRSLPAPTEAEGPPLPPERPAKLGSATRG